MYPHRHTMRAPYVEPPRVDMDWLREMPTPRTWPSPEAALQFHLRAGGRGRERAARRREACTDANVACDEPLRWHIPPASSPFGARFPVWAFWPPAYRVFNLNEPFGNGNVLSDSPVEGTRSHGTVHKGFRGELIGVSSALPGDLWETVYTTSPKRSYYLHSKSKLFTWGSSPGLMYCAPYASQRRPHSTNAPMWGWEAFAPSTEVFNTTAHNDTDRRFFRNWAVTFSTPALKERLLPHFLLVDDNGKEVPCRSMRGGVELYERPTHAHAHAHPGTNHTHSEHPHAAAEVEETRGENQTST